RGQGSPGLDEGTGAIGRPHCKANGVDLAIAAEVVGAGSPCPAHSAAGGNGMHPAGLIERPVAAGYPDSLTPVNRQSAVGAEVVGAGPAACADFERVLHDIYAVVLIECPNADTGPDVLGCISPQNAAAGEGVGTVAEKADTDGEVAADIVAPSGVSECP